MLSGSPSQSLQVRNFSTIQASSPAGESFSATPRVWGFVPCSSAYPDSSRWKLRIAARSAWSASVSGTRVFGRGRDRHVQVDGRAVLRVERADPRRDLGTPVPALRAVALVAEAAHQLGERPRDARHVPAARPCRLREPVAGQRRHDDVEGVRGPPAMGFGRVSRGMTSRNSRIDPGQPCISSSGNASAMLRTGVDEVDRLAVDRGAEVRELVELLLVLAPVVVVAPVVDELAQVVERDPVLPARVLDLVGDARQLEPACAGPPGRRRRPGSRNRSMSVAHRRSSASAARRRHRARRSDRRTSPRRAGAARPSPRTAAHGRRTAR